MKRTLLIRDRGAVLRNTRRGFNVLILGQVWPEVSSSAAGVRTHGIVSVLKKDHSVSFASPAKPNEHSKTLQEAGVTALRTDMNNSEAFRALLTRTCPDVVIFDRFTTEVFERGLITLLKHH